MMIDYQMRTPKPAYGYEALHQALDDAVEDANQMQGIGFAEGDMISVAMCTVLNFTKIVPKQTATEARDEHIRLVKLDAKYDQETHTIVKRCILRWHKRVFNDLENPKAERSEIHHPISNAMWLVLAYTQHWSNLQLPIDDGDVELDYNKLAEAIT